jgi:hypothetical protein
VIEMSKQDGYASRTAADLERKYNFGQTFAEVYNLVTDARKIAEEARSAYEGLDQEQIFNLLTNFGEDEGIYREDGKVYINASYIKGGKVAANYIDVDNLQVKAANVIGELSSATIKAQKITGGSLDFAKVTALNLKVTNAMIDGKISLSKVASISFNDLSDASAVRAELGGGITEDQAATLITDTLVSAPIIKAAEFKDWDERVTLTMDDATWNGTYGMLLRYRTREAFGVWCGSEMTSVAINGNDVLSSDGGITYPMGVWDFSGATVWGL